MAYDAICPRPGEDDGMLISLLRTNKEIQVPRYLQYLQYLLLLQTYFRHTGQLLPNQTSGNLRIEVDCATLAYYDWLTHVKQVATLSTGTRDPAKVLSIGHARRTGTPRTTRLCTWAASVAAPSRR